MEEVHTKRKNSYYIIVRDGKTKKSLTTTFYSEPGQLSEILKKIQKVFE